MRSKHGEQYLRKDPRIICKALATSLEYSLKVTIAVADFNLVSSLQRNGIRCSASAGDIIYIGTSPNCEQQILNILDGRGFWSKFSASP